MQAPSTPIAVSFFRALTAAGWQQTAGSASSTTLQRDRCLIVIASSADGVVVWNAFPSPTAANKNTSGTFTGPSPVAVGSFSMEGTEARLRVTSQAIDRGGRFVKEPFFDGDASAVFTKLVGESVRRVEEFVRSVERA